jgi:hypothetical protein
MKNRLLLLLLPLAPLVLCAQSQAEGEWTRLLDADLSHWDSYLSYRLQDSYEGKVPKDAAGAAIEPIGLNADTFGVFSVSSEDNEPVLKISGEIYGCLVTKKEYSNYHLRLKVKWSWF